MEFIDMMQERLDTREREWTQAHQVAEARRLGAINQPGFRATVDAWLVRAGRGAQHRQERRAVRCTHNEQITS